MITSTGHKHVPIRRRHLRRATCQEPSNTSDGHNFGKCRPIRTKLGRVMLVNTPDIIAPYLSQGATFVAKRHLGHCAPFWTQLRFNKPNAALNLNLRIRSAPKSAAPGLPVVFWSSRRTLSKRSVWHLHHIVSACAVGADGGPNRTPSGNISIRHQLDCSSPDLCSSPQMLQPAASYMNDWDGIRADSQHKGDWL